MSATHFTAPAPATEHAAFGTPPEAPQPPKRAWWKRPAALIGAGAFVLGALIGGANTPAPVEVEKRVEVPVDKIVEKRVEVPTTPASCATALDLAEQGFTYAAEVMGYQNDALQAAGRLDVAGINAASEKMKVVNPKLEALAPRMNAAKAECRAAK